MDEPIDIIFVDDHPIFRVGLRVILEEPGTPALRVLGEAADAPTALDLVEHLVPDVLIVDLQLHRDTDCASGIGLIQATRALSPHTQVLVLTAFEETDRLIRALQAGANGYIFKTEQLDSAEIRRALQEVAAGGHFYGPQVMKRIHEMLTQEDASAPLPRDQLTRREWEVLALIAADYSNQAIADTLVISIKTVKTHVSNILSKLQLRRRELAALYYHAHVTPQHPST
jgi:NarL family two-component system response regulator LiaR